MIFVEIKVFDLDHLLQKQYELHFYLLQGYCQVLQRIESWWSQLRKSVTDWWINVFKVMINSTGIAMSFIIFVQDMVQEGNFNPNNITHK